MSTFSKFTLIGFYTYVVDLFEYLELPEEIDKDTFVNALLLAHGERPVLYSDPNFYKEAIGMWGRKWYKSFLRMVLALDAEYNPIHNYDRYEEYDDVTKGAVYTEGADYNTGNSEVSGTNENLVSAFNSADYQADSKDVGITKTAAHNTLTHNNSETEDRTMSHKAHLYGNIGVKSSTEMQKEVMDLYGTTNIYDIMSEIFAKELLYQLF